MARLGQTVAVVNKSGKIVSNSKSLVGVFKEAKSIYGERKAEIKAKRNYEQEERRVQRNLDNLALDDNHSRASSRHGRKPSNRRGDRPKRPAADRGVTDTYYAAEASHNADEAPPPYLRHDLPRRHTDGELASPSSQRHSPPRTHSRTNSVVYRETEDPDMAYGDLPITDLTESQYPRDRQNQEVELRDKMSNLTRLLDEANCLQYSVTTMIETLQRDPDRLAAVGLALAEISTLARAMAPGALTAMKGTFPAAVALLASPQFMIAGGVALGVTVVALGGYKIIKKIKAQQGDGDDFDFLATFDKRDIFGKLRSRTGLGKARGEHGPHVDEIREIGGDLSRIELWRRGIADVEATSAGTSVDGEFVTQNAGRQLVEEGVLQPGQVRLSPSTTDGDGRKSKSNSRSKSKSEKGGEKRHSGSRNGTERDRKSHRHDSHSRHAHHSHRSRSERDGESAAGGGGGSSVSSVSRGDRKKRTTKHKEPSGLKMIFKK